MAKFSNTIVIYIISFITLMSLKPSIFFHNGIVKKNIYIFILIIAIFSYIISNIIS